MYGKNKATSVAFSFINKKTSTIYVLAFNDSLDCD